MALCFYKRLGLQNIILIKGKLEDLIIGFAYKMYSPGVALSLPKIKLSVSLSDIAVGEIQKR